MTTYQTKWGSSLVALRANWAEASCPIEQLDGDGDWSATQWQVADFGHSGTRALRAALLQCAESERIDEDEADELIADAMACATTH